MPRGYRHIVLAIGLIAFGWLGQAQEPSDTAEGQAEQQQEPAQSLPLPFPIEIVEDEAETEARQQAENEAGQREIDDLAAQQGMNAATQAMNEATQRMADDSSEMVLATWVGVFLLTATLVLMIQANRAAVRAAKAADETVKITREAHLNERRPWLFIAATVNGPVTIKDGAINFEILYCIRNVGPTPAVHVYQDIKVTVDQTRDFEFNVSANKLKEIAISTNKSIFPNKKYEFIQKVSISAAEITEFLSSHREFTSVHPMVYLIVAYQSPFGGGIMTTPHGCSLWRKWGEGFGTDAGSFGEDDVHLMDWGRSIPE